MNEQSMTSTPARVIRRKRSDEVVIPKMETDQKEDMVKKIQARRQFKSLAERVAGDQLFYRNYYYPGSSSHFKEDHMRCVDKYFPYAEGGGLYIDEPMLPHEEADCEKKRAAMKMLGLRYLIIKRNMNELDCIEALV